MPENCDNCPVSVMVDAMKQEFDRYREDSKGIHDKMDERIRGLETSKGVIETRLISIDEKLDKLISWREEQDGKPNKLLDKLKENGIWLVLAAALGALLARVGL